jgi:hypothetical protein
MARPTRPRDRSHAKVYEWWFDLPAWQNLSPPAVVLLVALLAAYRPWAASITLSDEQAGRLIGMSDSSGRRAIQELERWGWLEAINPGSFVRGRAPIYVLTPCPEAPGIMPRMTFRDMA